MSQDTRTEAERRYDDLKSGATYAYPSAWAADGSTLLDILIDDENDGQEHDDEDYEEDEVESRPVPPVPAGYPTDRALIYKWYGEVFITIDRRDGEMVICDKEDKTAPILPGEYTLALFRFFHEAPIEELMYYHWGQARPAMSSSAAELIERLSKLLDKLDAQDAAA